MKELEKVNETLIGYAIRFRPSKRMIRYLNFDDGHVKVVKYIIDATIVGTKEDANEVLKELNDNRLDVVGYKLQLLDIV